MDVKRLKILLILVFVFISLVIYRVVGNEEQKRVQELTYKPGMKATKGASAGVRAEESVQTGISPSRAKFSGVIKNPFSPLFPPPPPPVIRPPMPQPFPVITTKGPSPAKLESGRLKFIGLLQKEGERKVFLSKDKEIFIVKKGDKVGTLYVGNITDTSIIMKSSDNSEEFKINIDEVKPTRSGPAPGRGRR